MQIGLYICDELPRIRRSMFQIFKGASGGILFHFSPNQSEFESRPERNFA